MNKIQQVLGWANKRLVLQGKELGETQMEVLDFVLRQSTSDENDRLLELTKRHKKIMAEKNIIVSVYTNASGFLWNMAKVDSGTDLGYSEYNGNCKESGSFIEYEDALEDAIALIEKCDLEKFRKDTPSKKFHWGNYAEHLNKFR